MKITNTITIITGGSTGFGCALASELCNRGGRVVIADILVESGLKLALELNLRHPLSAVFGECDVTKKADIFGMFKLAVDTWGEYVDILVNNADSWEKVLAVDIQAVILGTRLAVQHFKSHKKHGIIINTASEAGLFPASPQPVYAAAKAAVVHFTRSLAYLSKKNNIRVNAVCPGFVKTALAKDAGKSFKISSWIPIENVTAAFIECIENESLRGECIHISCRRPNYIVPFKDMQKSML